MWLHGEVLVITNHETRDCCKLASMQSTKELWGEIVKIYGETNAPHLFNLKKGLSRKITWGLEYTTAKLKSYGTRLLSLKRCQTTKCGVMEKCTSNVLKKMLDIQATNRTLKFIMGLNECYEQMKSNVLSMDPLLPVNRVYNLFLQRSKNKSLER